MRLPFFIVDAFARKPFSGNPAAVVFLEKELEETEYLKFSSEFNLSETAFILPFGGSSHKNATRFSLRWFTPTVEVNLCGHATLASCAALEAFGNAASCFEFETLSGLLKGLKHGKNWCLQFPSNAPVEKDRNWHSEVSTSIFDNLQVISSILYSSATKKMIIILDKKLPVDFLRDLKVDSAKMFASCPSGKVVRGVSITKACAEDEELDFVSRYFSPWNGIPEDPVNGSSHTNLAPLWSKLLGKVELRAKMVSKRGGELFLKVGENQVMIGGPSYLFAAGHLSF
ncbi:unnamed protein product [Oikopleura dioica]|uniref:Phenazine biosynthesis-like domain-containing protein n=1 Tax=Oikopleura dioica TaxID=34765 RepID=E4YLM7_OIKDI|nr:unnamed protein product [Oikopleura dioica]